MSGIQGDLEQISKSDKKLFDKDKKLNTKKVSLLLNILTIIHNSQTQTSIIKSIFEPPPQSESGVTNMKYLKYFQLKPGIEETI